MILHLELCKRILDQGCDFNCDEYCDGVMGLMASYPSDKTQASLASHIEKYANTRTQCETTVIVLTANTRQIISCLQRALVCIWLVNCDCGMLKLDVLQQIKKDDGVRRMIYQTYRTMSFVSEFDENNKVHREIEVACQTIASEIACHYIDWVVKRLIKQYKKVVKSGELVDRVVCLERYHSKINLCNR
jgi:hypothetical protein